MENNELSEKLLVTFRNNWLEALTQLVIVKAQLEVISDKYEKGENQIKELQKRIEALKQSNKPAPQVEK